MKNKILTIVWIIVFIGVLVLLNIFMEKQSQNYQKQYGALNDLISLFIQTTK